MNRSSRVGRAVLHPSTLAVFSGFLGAIIAFLINLASGGKASQLIWIAIIFAILFSLSITAWQVYTQEQAGKQWMTMLQEMTFQTYFLTLLTDKPEISQMAQQRLGQVLKTLSGDQQASMLQFFSHNGLPTSFIGDALQGSAGLVGADLHKITLPQIYLERANLSRVNFREANLSEAHLSDTILYRADLSGANLSHARLNRSNLKGINLRGANLTGADLSNVYMDIERAGRDGSLVKIGRVLYPVLRANLSNARLSHAKMRAANLIGADLNGAQLQGADLTKANLSYANLQGVDLTDATLTEAILVGTNLQGADLKGAMLNSAVLDDVDIRSAKVAEEQLQTLSIGRHLKREP
jgi:uncharacterized protein YjbI with pentapeptide repeats